MADYYEMIKRLYKKQFGNKWGLAYGRTLNKARHFYSKNKRVTEYLTSSNNVMRLAYNIAANTGVKTLLKLNENIDKKFSNITIEEADIARLMPMYAGYEGVRPIIDRYINKEITKDELNRLLKQFRNSVEYLMGSD